MREKRENRERVEKREKRKQEIERDVKNEWMRERERKGVIDRYKMTIMYATRRQTNGNIPITEPK